MIPRFSLLAERLRTELINIEQLVARAEGAVLRAEQAPQDRDYFIAAAALDLFGFYAGMERLFEVLAGEIDKSRPTGPQWHRDLLTQMTLSIPGLRPAVISTETASALADYLEFRHIVRNAYTFNLKNERVVDPVGNLQKTFELSRRDLLAFINFLEKLSTLMRSLIRKQARSCSQTESHCDQFHSEGRSSIDKETRPPVIANISTPSSALLSERNPAYCHCEAVFAEAISWMVRR